MGTIRRLTDLQLASIATTKLISVTSSQVLFNLGSGNRAFEATNLGVYPIYYGDSSLTTSSGGLIQSQGAKFWDTVTDNFTMYFKTASSGLTSNLVIQEYAGN